MHVYAHVLDCLHEYEYEGMQYAEDVYQESMAFLTTCTDLITSVILVRTIERGGGFAQTTINKGLVILFLR